MRGLFFIRVISWAIVADLYNIIIYTCIGSRYVAGDGTANILINFTIVEPYLDEHRLCKSTCRVLFLSPSHYYVPTQVQQRQCVCNLNTHAHAHILVTAGDRRSDKSRKFEHMLAKKNKKTSTTKTNNWYNDMRVHVCIILNSKWIKIAGQGVPCTRVHNSILLYGWLFF